MSEGESDSSSCEPPQKDVENFPRLPFSIDAILSRTFPSSNHPITSQIQYPTSTLNTVSGVSTLEASPPEGQASPLDSQQPFPAWIFCTRYSDRPSAGTRTKRSRKRESPTDDEKRPRTAFTAQQIRILSQQFLDNRYLTEKRRQELAHELGLNESQIKIWFQNKRAKLKKAAALNPSSSTSSHHFDGTIATST